MFLERLAARFWLDFASASQACSGWAACRLARNPPRRERCGNSVWLSSLWIWRDNIWRGARCRLDQHYPSPYPLPQGEGKQPRARFARSKNQTRQSAPERRAQRLICRLGGAACWTLRKNSAINVALYYG